MAIFHAVILTPMLFLYNLEGMDRSCEMTSEYEVAVKLYQLIVSTMFYSVTHFIMVLTASVVFVYQLKERRTSGVLKEHIFGSRNQNNNSETKTSKRNDTVSIEMDRKAHRRSSNANAVLTNFIYAGPGKMISTKSIDDKAKDVAPTIKENQSNTIGDPSKFEHQPVASSLSYKMKNGTSISKSSNFSHTKKMTQQAS